MLAKRPQVVALNKVDIPESKVNIKRFKKSFSKIKIYPISAATGEGVKELLESVYKKVKSVKRYGKI